MTLSKMIWDALYVWFDYRSVYLGKTTENKNITKIGIARSTKDRWKQINDSITDGRQYPIFAVKVFFAEKTETKLHQKYRHKHTPYKGSGGTEWYKLTPTEEAQVKVELFVLSLVSWVKIIVGLFIFLFLLYCTAIGLVVLTSEYGLKLIELCKDSFFQ